MAPSPRPYRGQRARDRRRLAAGAGPRVLCGDLNAPRRELPDETVISFARDSQTRLRPERAERWDSAELGVVPGLRELGFTDAFRAVHGHERREPSWIYRRGGGGYRLDHVFAAASRCSARRTTIRGETTASVTTRRWRPT